MCCAPFDSGRLACRTHRRSHYHMGNSSWSVQEALGAFNFRKVTNATGTFVSYRADVGLSRFAMLHHANGPRMPTKFKEPIVVSLYETVDKLHYRVWIEQYESVTDFLAVIHQCIPWNIPTCSQLRCKNKPMPDSNVCEKHAEVDLAV